MKIWLLVALCGGCSVYDNKLIDTAGVRSGAVTAGAGPEAAGRSAGAGGNGAAGVAGTTGVQSDTPCGDGRITGTELCDTGIPDGMPGACPTSCASRDSCWPAMRTGSGCNVTCVQVAVACGPKDGCCSAQCTPGSDPDCSGSCGDGVVDPSRGELCEVGEGVQPSQRCPTAHDCADTDPCTDDALTGSASNCNAACAHTPITASRAGDKCCPSGANAMTDSDCMPKCGNGVREGTEACDGTAGCDASCNLTITSAQQMCLAAHSGNACAECECTHCTDQLLACGGSGDANRDKACSSVEACAVQHQCVGRTCYCGTAQSDLECALFADGACKSVIETATGTTNVYTITSQEADASSALGRANALGLCRRANCSNECK